MISAALAAEAAGAEQHSLLEAPELWVAVAFILVVGFAARPVAKALTSALDARRDKIRARLEEAQRLREDAQALLAEYQKKQRDAMKEAEAILDHARAEAERLAAQAAADLEASLKRREQQALDRIAQAETQALKEVRNAAVDVAMAATRRIIADNLTDKQAAKLIDGAIKDLPGRLH